MRSQSKLFLFILTCASAFAGHAARATTPLCLAMGDGPRVTLVARSPAPIADGPRPDAPFLQFAPGGRTLLVPAAGDLNAFEVRDVDGKLVRRVDPGAPLAVVGFAGGDRSLASFSLSNDDGRPPSIAVGDVDKRFVYLSRPDKPRLLGPGYEWLNQEVFAWYGPDGAHALRVPHEGKPVAVYAPFRPPANAHVMLTRDVSRLIFVFAKSMRSLVLPIPWGAEDGFSEDDVAALSLASEQEADVAEDADGVIYQAMLSGDGMTLLTAASEGSSLVLRVRRLDNLAPEITVTITSAPSRPLVAISQNGMRAAIAQGREIRMIDLHGHVLGSLRGSAFGNGQVARIAFAGDDEIIAQKDFGAAIRWRP